MASKKTIEERRAELNKRIEALKAKERDLAASEAQERRKLETREKIVLGGAIMAHCKIDGEFAVQVRAALNKALTKEADRELLKAWLTNGNKGASKPKKPPEDEGSSDEPKT